MRLGISIVNVWDRKLKFVGSETMYEVADLVRHNCVCVEAGW